MVRVIGRVAEHYEVEEAKFARFRGGIPRASWRVQMRQEDDLEKVGRYRPYARLCVRGKSTWPASVKRWSSGC